MNLPGLFLIAVGLSMDAFAVAVCKGLALSKINWKNAVLVGIWFGSFQALMPMAGYLLGRRFRDSITLIDHWISFILLVLIGVSMIREALSAQDACSDASLAPGTMLLLAAATSIDALAAGITFAFLKAAILPAVAFIGVITFLLSTAGVKAGNSLGLRFKTGAGLAGGVILILMGSKILLEHLGLV